MTSCTTLDNTLRAVAGFPAIEDRDISEEIEALAVDIEQSITEWEQRIDELPDFEDRNSSSVPQVSGTVLLDESR